MEEKTNVMRLLEQKKVSYQAYSCEGAEGLTGLEMAIKLSQNPDRVFKTLVTYGSKTKKNYVFVIPVNCELDLKKAAKSVGEKSIDMIKSKELLPLTGYVHGGCSPIGMKKLFVTRVHETAGNFDTILFSAGKIGRQVEVSLEGLGKMIPFELADLTEEI